MDMGFIVEGTNDELKVREMFTKYYPHVKLYFAITHGTRFTNRTKQDVLKLMQTTRNAFYLLDNDDSGDMLYEKMVREFPIQKITLEADKCNCVRGRKHKTGVEHASIEYLYEVLAPVVEECNYPRWRRFNAFAKTYGLSEETNLALNLYGGKE